MAPDSWRYLDLGAPGPYDLAGAMPVLTMAVHSTGRPVMTTAVWGQTHLNVGWFDDVDSTLDLAACERLGVQVIRRPMFGGGTAYYQEGCSAMWSWLLPRADDEPELDDHLDRFQPVVLDALDRLGCGGAAFEGSSDLRWRDRKLGALTVQDVMVCISVGGFVNIAPPDLDTYLEVVRIPDDKFADKAVKDMRDYVCTLEQVAGRPVGYDDLRDALLAAAASAGLSLSAEPFTDDEQAGVDKIGARARRDENVRRVSSERFAAEAPAGTTVGFGNHKGAKLCRAGVAVDRDGTVAAAMMAGDMHVSPPDTLDRVAQALTGARAGDRDDLRRRVASVFEGPDVRQADAHLGVTTDDLVSAVTKAAAEAAAEVAR